MTITITISTVNLSGDRWISVTEIGGIKIKGLVTDSEDEAVLSLFQEMSKSEDAKVALLMNLSGYSLETLGEIGPA